MMMMNNKLHRSFLRATLLTSSSPHIRRIAFVMCQNNLSTPLSSLRFTSSISTKTIELPCNTEFNRYEELKTREWFGKLRWLFCPPANINAEFVKAEILDKFKWVREEDIRDQDCALLANLAVLLKTSFESEYDRKYFIVKLAKHLLAPLFSGSPARNNEEFLKKCVRGPNGSHVASFAKDEGTYDDVIKSEFSGKVHLDPEVGCYTDAFPQSRYNVLLLDGEIGCGKTHAALAAFPSVLTLYLRLQDRFDSTPLVREKGPTVSEENISEQFVKNIVHFCEEALPERPKHPPSPHRGRCGRVAAHLVVDDLETLPAVFSMLMQTCHTIREELALLLRCDPDEIYITCIGSGLAGSVVVPSPHRCYFMGALEKQNSGHQKMLWPLVADLVDKNIYDEVPEEKKQHLRNVVEDLCADPIIAPLLGNWRATSLLATHVMRSFREKDEEKFLRAVLPDKCLQSVAFFFTTYHKTRLICPLLYNTAFRKAMCGPLLSESDRRCDNTTNEITDDERWLICVQGIMVYNMKRGMKRRLRMPRCVALVLLGSLLPKMYRPPLSGTAASKHNPLTVAFMHKAFMVLIYGSSAQEAREMLKLDEESVEVSPGTTQDVDKRSRESSAVSDNWRGDKVKVVRFTTTNATMKSVNKFVKTMQTELRTDTRYVVELSHAETDWESPWYGDVLLVGRGLLCYVHCQEVNCCEAARYKTVRRILNDKITKRLCSITGVERSNVDVVFLATKGRGEAEAPSLSFCTTTTTTGKVETKSHKRKQKNMPPMPCRVKVCTPPADHDDIHEDILFPLSWPSFERWCQPQDPPQALVVAKEGCEKE